MRRKISLLFFTLLAVVSMAQKQVTVEKLSPQLALFLQTQKGQMLSRSSEQQSGDVQRMELLAKLTESADTLRLKAQYDMQIERCIGRVLIVSVPVSQLLALAHDEQVERLEAERMPRPMLDNVPQQIGADRVNAGSATEGIQAYKGKDVVVGIVDAGFDYVNPFFRDAQGKTRIQWAADYVANKTYNGSEAVVAAMHSSDAATMLHGTHVAGIAAGSRVNDINDVFYQGIAPEADIAEGAINSEISSSGLNSSQAIKAFSDIFDYAKTQQKPCVINFSMGDAMSFVDSRQLEEEAIRTLLSEPGRALVVASGNAGGTSRFAHKEATLAEGGAGVWFNEDEQYGTYFGIEVKMLPTQTLQLRYMDSTYKTNKGEVSMSGTELASQTTLTMGSKRLTVQYRGKTGDGYDAIYITAGLASFATSERVLVTIKGEGDAWIYADALCAQLENVPAQYVANHALAQDGYSMTWPAQMNEVVTVGNIAHRLKIVTMANKYASQGGVATPTDLTPYESTKGEGYLAKSSSVGPTLNGQIKPDVCAPGVNVVSAYNNFVNETTDMQYAAWLIGILDTEYEQEYGGYFVTLAQTGTSMSAPAVTGTIALWMQADPTLTTAKIKEVIAASSRQPDSELQYPNNQYGYGEVDAYRGLCYILGIDKIEGITAAQPQQAAFRLNGRKLSVEFVAIPSQQTELRVYSTDGRLLLTEQGTSVDLSSLPHGVYAVQLNTGNKATTGSTLIRL